MKDGLDADAVARIAKNLRRAWKEFPAQAFLRDATVGLDELELKQRIAHVIAALAQHLPKDFERALAVLLEAGGAWDAGDPDDPLSGFAAWPVIDYVGVHGLERPEESLEGLRQLTHLFSAEMAVRPFLRQQTELTLQTLAVWTDDENEHVRRLVSEGTRPRLPWAGRLTDFIRDPSPVLALLEQLKDDSSEYVRRSVANNLNDISKDHPQRVVEVCRDWQKSAGTERLWVIRHATRTLVKAGHPQVWRLLGYADPPEVAVRRLRIEETTIRLGAYLEFSFQLRSQSGEPQRLIVDYQVHHVKANGKTTPKVFKLKTLELLPGAAVDVGKRHPFRQVTTRRYYSGTHTLEILVNGQSAGKRRFELLVE